ncbi:zinc finger and BTB domain-containing protein 7B-like isoform X1 [Macrosteles quadrilineatus]|uniref:zinc finger and BTB domain-containing protein 7B-like isoform X1 n=1 Tax=Macrosteles quadrilineatus TaxID=74068 RepID=UPI0023E22308|nr:zinc finger and BTB domain-containing protein 7B-like isoform X1 [Macrosteles quadrilineatus]XP_054269853.1 zinc finger and BTB domain-containing protein 7B-like isoform X1 [Macrosteles quadrilineatus]
MGSEHYCLRWNNHQNNLLGVFSQLLQDESLVDVTLACAEGHSIRAHKVVLSACSSYFQSLFVDHPGRHPIVILKDVCFSELRTLVEFMYRGEVNVEYCRLSALLKTAESLKVKGLAEMTHLRGAGAAPPRQDDSEPPRAPEQPPASITPRPDTPPTTNPTTPPDAADHDARSRSPEAEDDLSSGPSDMTISRLPSPHTTEPQPGPSGLPPVQQVPLSLKKEVDWDRPEESDGRRSVTGESSSEYRHPHDPEVCLVEGVYGPSCFPRHRGTPYDQLASGRSATPFQYPPFPPLPPCYPHSETLLSLLSQQGLLPPLPPTEGTLRCAVCLAGFPSAWLLEQHTALQHSGQAPRSHAPEPTEDKPFRCDQCGQSYRYRSAFLKHREQNHRARLPADKLFTCDVCGMQFRYLKSFKKHRLNHALERLHNPFHRPGSAASDSRRSERSERSEQSERSERSESESHDRGDRSDTRSENSERSEGVSTSARSVNDEVTSTNEAEGSNNRPPTSPCPPEQDDTVDSLALALGSSEASLLGLLSLGAEERQRERRSFACPFCGKCVRSKENLKLHVRKHTGERPFACLFCGRAFGGKSDLTRHLRIHTGERPYHCEMCGKCFARADYLSKHLTTHIHNSHHQR